jgi:hypothetical protein
MSSQRNQDGNGNGNGNGNGDHFDEVDAVRRFPGEDTWLDLPMPDLHETAAQDGEQSSAGHIGNGQESANNLSFIDRVMQARQADLQLDAQLAAMEQLLPSELLAEYAAPTPSSSFVSTTVEKVMQDRRQRWQEMLSRHVAPEPSNEFVARTLAALQEASQSQQGQPQRSQPQSSQERQGSGITAASPTVATNLRLQAPPAPNRSQHWSVFSLVAAAAAAMIWLMVSREQRAPLELRLALQASPAVAYSDSTTPMSAILAHIAADEEPLATFDAPADGLWLIGTQGGLR